MSVLALIMYRATDIGFVTDLLRRHPWSRFPVRESQRLTIVPADKPIWMGDMWLLRSEPNRYVIATPHDGPWMRGMGHAPNQDYRPPTDLEWARFKCGIRARYVDAKAAVE